MTEHTLRDAWRQCSRNFRWGSCGACPRDTDGNAYPEFCLFTHRNFDHHLTMDDLVAATKMFLREKQQKHLDELEKTGKLQE
jgi:hypothetical protein